MNGAKHTELRFQPQFSVLLIIHRNVFEKKELWGGESFQFQCSVLTLSSNTETPMPPAAPDPARPMKWPLPMLLANSDAPTCKTVKISDGRCSVWDFMQWINCHPGLLKTMLCNKT